MPVLWCGLRFKRLTIDLLSVGVYMKGSISPRNVIEIALSEILSRIDEKFQAKEKIKILEKQ